MWCSGNSLVFLKCLSVTWSTGKKLTVALYSGHMLAMVVRSGTDSWETPEPKNSTNLPEIPAWRKCWKTSKFTRNFLAHFIQPVLNFAFLAPLWSKDKKCFVFFWLNDSRGDVCSGYLEWNNKKKKTLSWPKPSEEPLKQRELSSFYSIYFSLN